MEENFFRAAFVLLLVISVIPIWLVEYVPLQDLPQHLLRTDIERKIIQNDQFYSEYFELNLFTAYLSSDLALLFLTWFFGLMIGTKIFLSMLIILFPIAFLYFLEGAGADKKWSLFAFTFSYNYFFLMGFLNFVLGIIFFLFLFGYWHKTELKEKRQKIIFSAGIILLYFTHLLVLGFVLVSILIVSIKEKRKLQKEIIGLIISLLLLSFLNPAKSAFTKGISDYSLWTIIDFRFVLHAVSGTPQTLLFGALAIAILAYYLVKSGEKKFLPVSLLFLELTIIVPRGTGDASFLRERFLFFSILFLFVGLKNEMPKKMGVTAIALGIIIITGTAMAFCSVEPEITSRIADQSIIPEKSHVEIKNIEMPFNESFSDPALHLWCYMAIKKNIFSESIFGYKKMDFLPIKSKKEFPAAKEKYLIIDDLGMQKNLLEKLLTNSNIEILIKRKDYAILRENG